MARPKKINQDQQDSATVQPVSQDVEQFDDIFSNPDGLSDADVAVKGVDASAVVNIQVSEEKVVEQVAGEKVEQSVDEHTFIELFTNPNGLDEKHVKLKDPTPIVLPTQEELDAQARALDARRRAFYMGN